MVCGCFSEKVGQSRDGTGGLYILGILDRIGCCLALELVPRGKGSIETTCSHIGYTILYCREELIVVREKRLSYLLKYIETRPNN